MSLILLALFLAPTCLLMVLSPKQSQKILKEWAASSVLQFMTSLFLLFFAMILVLSTGFTLNFWNSGSTGGWHFNSQIILSWVAVLTALKAIACLFPRLSAWKLRFLTETRLPMFGFLGLLLCLGMVYLETQVF